MPAKLLYSHSGIRPPALRSIQQATRNRIQSIMCRKQTSIPLPSTAPEPFDNIDADVILRSSDNVDFRVFKIILSLTSPVFKDMFTLPQPDNQSPTSPSAIPVSGEQCDPSDSTITLLSRHEADIQLIQGGSVLWPSMHYAVSLDWKELAERAARQTLKIKELGRASLYTEEMEEMTAGSYHKLLAFHFACGVAAAGVGKSKKWIPSDLQKEMCKCGCYVMSHYSVQTYLTETSCELLLRPDSPILLNTESAFKNALNTITTSGARHGCTVTVMIDRIEHLRCLYVAQIEKVLLEVQLEFKS
ncbi:hypothetical protein BU15DRAFT_73833 [Melanogaster broomeanus]|nr:hypothetical protein BU15DRAFT_73833 [Melanogaster broomeanus]